MTFNTRRTAIFFGFLLTAGCGGQNALDQQDPEQPVESGTRVNVNLRDAPLTEVARFLATTTGVPVIIDPDAQEAAGETRISILSPGAIPPDRIITLIREAIAPHGFALEWTADGLILRRSGQRDPPMVERGLPFSEEAEVAINSGVGVISETERQITREARALLFPEKHQDFSMGSFRVLPSTSLDSSGYKLYGIRRTSVAGCLGLRNGDILSHVAGQ